MYSTALSPRSNGVEEEGGAAQEFGRENGRESTFDRSRAGPACSAPAQIHQVHRLPPFVGLADKPLEWRGWNAVRNVRRLARIRKAETQRQRGSPPSGVSWQW